MLSYGKAHFYIRPYCDFDFGIELAKRIANENDCRQTASRRFNAKRKKDIRNFEANTRLDLESGESVDYLRSGIVSERKADFGKSGKFGASVLLTVDVIHSELGPFLNKVDAELKTAARFPLPRTTQIIDDALITKYDDLLLNELTKKRGTTEFTQNDYDLYGVDFVFADDGTHTIMYPGAPRLELEETSHRSPFVKTKAA